MQVSFTVVTSNKGTSYFLKIGEIREFREVLISFDQNKKIFKVSLFASFCI